MRDVCNVKLFSKLLCLIIVFVSMLSACDESDPLPDGVSSMPDVETESLIDSDTGEIRWPAELLPEGFPEAEYTEIYSAERKDNEVVIVMFAEYNKKRPAAYAFESDLNLKYGYRTVVDIETGLAYAFNSDGYRVAISSSRDTDTHLAAINEKSPTGYTYEIRVVITDTKIESLFWQYPDANTDLGLEEKVFEEWDTSVFPKNFPKPTAGLIIESIEQKSNGVFLMLKGTISDRQVYLNEIYKSGFYVTGVQPFPNDNGDYFFEGFNEYPTGPNDSVSFYFQICKNNDKVVK